MIPNGNSCLRGSRFHASCVNMLIQKVFTRERDSSCLTRCCDGTRVSPKAGFPMSSTRTGQNIDSQPLPNAEARTILRAKTVATRLSIEELEEVESAAKRDGKTLAEWLRATVLREARQRPADPVELILAELSATRSMLLNCFLLTAQAGAEGKQLLPETVLKIRDKADALKPQIARKMLQEFWAQDGQNGGKS